MAGAAFALAVALGACGGSSGSDDTAGSAAPTVGSTAPAPTTLAPATLPPTTTSPGFGSGACPEAAIAAYLRTLPNAPEYAGDCAATDLARDVGKWCSALQSDPTDSRRYIIGPTFSGAAEILTVDRRGAEWVVSAHTPAPQPG